MHQAEYKIKFVYKFVINGQCYEFQGERSFRLTFDGNVLAILSFLSWWLNNNMIMMFKIYKSCYTPFFTLNFKKTYFCLSIFFTTKGITIHSFIINLENSWFKPKMKTNVLFAKYQFLPLKCNCSLSGHCLIFSLHNDYCNLSSY